ncbi:MAG: hypothetical protein NT023_16260 [Armatimonadetes bacterium]|nr:hypothetical protein [Armatimonadota bacterium]
MRQSRMTSEGLLFQPNTSGKSYLCIKYHRDGSSGKSQWQIREIEEHSIFCWADEGNWCDVRGHYWGTHDKGRTELGVKGERICIFPCPSNPTDVWHGYPISHSLGGSMTKDLIDVVQRFIDAQVIDKTLGRNIQRGKI